MDKEAVKKVQSFRRTFSEYFGIHLRKGWSGRRYMDKDEMYYDLGTREIEYSYQYSSTDAAVAVLFHELGHFIFDPASSRCSL